MVLDIRRVLTSNAFNALTNEEQEKFLNLYIEMNIVGFNSKLFEIFKVKFVSLKEKENEN